MANSRPSKGSRDNRANQLNPSHPAYHRSRAISPSDAERAARDIRTRQQATKSPTPSALTPARPLTTRRMS
jgi:hypothetical protein